MLRKVHFWLGMRNDVKKRALNVLNANKPNQKVLPHSLYTPLPVLASFWIDISMYFVLLLPRTKYGKDNIVVVVDVFSKMTHFIPYFKTKDAPHTADLFVKKVVKLYGILKKVVSDRDTKFLSHFWSIFWGMLGTKLPFSTSCHLQTNGQMEVVSMTLENMLRVVLKEKLTSWEEHLHMIVFACNYPLF